MAGRFPTGNRLIALIALTAASASTYASGVAADPRAVHAMGLAGKKAPAALENRGDPNEPIATATPLLATPLLATLVQTHTDERVQLDEVSPPQTRFDALLADRVTGAKCALDPRLLALLRTIVSRVRANVAAATPDAALPRIELVSGFRSPKLNEMLRKKGHHVASHSQHSLGHAVDFRIVLDGESRGIDPRELARAIRASGWIGGVGIYLLQDDWFVHADVGPNRSWNG